MSEVASRELRNNTAGLIRRAAAGEEIVITVNGKPAARLTSLPEPPSGRRKWMPREELIELLLQSQADPTLRDDLKFLGDDTTDDLDPLT